jgi:crotonobetainyl-CoA:carnitine CoA-transferase CaiB-like acyl-CoA transferase
MTEPLFAGLKVIDCASYVAAPAAATVLADFGADVIKIEPPGEGDPWRTDHRTMPARSVAGMGDRPTAMALYGAIVTALYRREKTGRGGEVPVVAAPGFGEHGGAILREAGYSEGEISEPRAAGVVGGGEALPAPRRARA